MGIDDRCVRFVLWLVLDSSFSLDFVCPAYFCPPCISAKFFSLAHEGCKHNVIKEQKTSTSPLPSPTTAPTQASRSKARDQVSSIHSNRKQPVYLDTLDRGVLIE